jgi:hypothetical protein
MPHQSIKHCDSCRFWQIEGTQTGKCRRHAPTVIVLDDRDQSVWPYSLDDDWCGEYEDMREA